MARKRITERPVEIVIEISFESVYCERCILPVYHRVERSPPLPEWKATCTVCGMQSIQGVDDYQPPGE